MTTSSYPSQKNLPVTLNSFAEKIAREYGRFDDLAKIYNSIGNQTAIYAGKIALSIINSSFYKDLFTLADYYERLKKQYAITEKEAIDILKKYKWLISLSMSDGFIFEAARISRLKGNQSAQINKLFIWVENHCLWQ